jgi:hypothetical protein
VNSDSRLTIHDSRPGRSCPPDYRYRPSDLARTADVQAEVLYAVGGLYGNRAALDAVLDLAHGERQLPRIVFNGDFNWFNVDTDGFRHVNETVLGHTALRGNVETEIAREDDAAGCGCAYPDWINDGEVERSNRIGARLRATARAFPQLRPALASLPMHLTARVAGIRIAVVHGDAESLAGWDFSQEALADPGHVTHVAGWFREARVDLFASSHTCLPVAFDVGPAHGAGVLFNNGAAGMPNFRGHREGLITRIGPTPHPHALYGTRIGRAHVEAVPVAYHHVRWERLFLDNWPADSPAHESYYRRIASGPSYGLHEAVRIRAGRTA